jgi:hypothetical protein
MVTVIVSRSRRNLVIGVMALLLIAIGITAAVSVASDSPTSLDSLELSVARYMDASLGVYSPLATTSADNSICSHSSCTFSNEVARSSTQAIEQLSDVQIANPSSIKWTSAPIIEKRFNVGLLTSRNNQVFLNNATSNASSEAIQVGNAFVTSETSYLRGALSSCATHICVITSGAGASIVSFESEVVKGNSAAIHAIVKEWQQTSTINARGVIGAWNTATNELNDTFSLLKLKGKWLVNSVTGSFVPGQGP